MKVTFLAVSFTAASSAVGVSAFCPTAPTQRNVIARTTTTTILVDTALHGYLDKLSDYTADNNPDETAKANDEDSKQATNLARDKVDRFSVGDWTGFVDFHEFDGGDGQMGIAGDGKAGLSKEWDKEAQMAKSKMRSATNAWGANSGYAETLREQGVETSRAQQLENWHSQQEVLAQRKQQRWLTDGFDQSTGSGNDDDWRQLAKFGVERNQDFDLDATFGDVVPGQIMSEIHLESRIGQPKVYDFSLKNSFMGYSDFRARFCGPSCGDWTVEPEEGSISGKQGTDFVVRYRPQGPGGSEAYLVIDTEDDKWTYKCTGMASM